MAEEKEIDKKNWLIADSKNSNEFLDSPKTSWVFVDLHIHSRFSRACSKDLTIPNLVKWGRVKGIRILGTGDFTHNTWLSELKQMKIVDGILYYSDENGEFPFILTSEISLVYNHDTHQSI